MACLKFGTRWAVKECLKTYHELSISKFINYNSSKGFADDDWWPDHSNHVYWEWNKADVQTAPIPFDGVPFMFIGHRHMACHQGANVAKKRKTDSNFKRPFAQGNMLLHSRTRTQGSKKVGCPALIRITRIAKFPQFKLSGKVTVSRKRELARALKLALYEVSSPVKWNEVYYVCLPSVKEHVGHPVASQQNSTSPSVHMDPKVEERIVELTKNGVKNVGEMKGLIEEYINACLDRIASPHKLLPSDMDIRSVMKQTREEMYKHAFEQEDSSSESDEIFSSSHLSKVDGSRIDGKRSVLKKQCIDRLQSIMSIVPSIKNEKQLAKLAHNLGGIHSSTTTSIPVVNQSKPNNFKPIQVIIESDSPALTNPELFSPAPLSIVEIAIHDDIIIASE